MNHFILWIKRSLPHRWSTVNIILFLFSYHIEILGSRAVQIQSRRFFYPGRLLTVFCLSYLMEMVLFSTKYKFALKVLKTKKSIMKKNVCQISLMLMSIYLSAFSVTSFSCSLFLSFLYLYLISLFLYVLKINGILHSFVTCFVYSILNHAFLSMPVNTDLHHYFKG